MRINYRQKQGVRSCRKSWPEKLFNRLQILWVCL